ncbi:uncharacterized protein CcaverHIS019_0401940 [Cutaneotrichosporon cavernicola]|uniref:Major facilitator superfamily (MFS) profile domain-containing protein n=1 Tax=Cutaneotrichosporon cavernicola TaxID=279322 RepID=A0AA48L3N3_9TREE|nr:uncharacterized protein CcaverHIS019_0401940 [Cutaneotrichosporon cavernicola]BEI91374.1 hypothetical protein CcaverHIS019_0401940 [Cutaneotrichosporon cavernicola]
MDDAKPTQVAASKPDEAVRQPPTTSSTPSTFLGTYSTATHYQADAVSTPTVVLLWAAIHVLVVLQPDPVHPFLPRFLSSRLWFELQVRFRLAPRALGIGATQVSLRWAAAGPRQSITWALRYTNENRYEAARYLVWMGVMRAWTAVSHIQSLPGSKGQIARALSVPLPSMAGSHLHIGEVYGALILPLRPFQPAPDFAYMSLSKQAVLEVDISEVRPTARELEDGIELAPLPSSERSKDVLASDSETPAASTAEDASHLLDDEAPDGGQQAWIIVACCTILCFWFVGTTYSWGVLQGALVADHLAPASTLAFVGSIAVSMLSALAILNSRLFGQVGARPMALVGVAFMASSQLLAGFTTKNVGGLFVTAGVMMGLGVSLCFMVISITPSQYFTRRKGTALGIVYSGGGFGGAIISLALEAGVRHLGVPWTFRLVGFLMLATCVPAAWFIKERFSPQRREFVDWSLFKNLDFVALFAAGVLGTFPLFVPPFFLPLYAASMNLSTTTGAILVCLFNFSSALGRLATGVLSDRLLGPINTLLLVLSITSLSLLVLWPTSVSLGPLIVFVLINGAASGGFFAIMPTVVSTVMGTQRMAVAFGMIVTGWGGGYLMGAPTAGYLLAAFGGSGEGIKAYRPAVFWAGAMALAASAIVAALRWRKSPHWRVRM